jgi:hypothetical protein
MTQPHEITLTFDENGNVAATVTGIAGPGCAEASAWLDKLGDIEQDVATPDYYTTPVAQTAHVTGGEGGDW